MILEILRTWTRVLPVVVAAPLIFLLPTLAEGAQHIVEYQIGMYANTQGFGDAASSEIRLAFGIIKILALLYVTLWVPRFWFHQGQKTSLAFDGGEIKSLLTLLGFSALIMAVLIIGGPLLTSLVINNGIPVPSELLPFLPILILLLFAGQGERFSARWLGVFLGDPHMTRERAKTAFKGKRLVANFVFFVPLAPLMAAHYWIGYNTASFALWPQVALLTLDSLLVGVMAIVMGNAMYAMYQIISSSDVGTE